MHTETLSITVATYREGVAYGTLSARLWHDGSEDHAEVIYTGGARSFALDGPKALAFLTVVVRDAAEMLSRTSPGNTGASNVPEPRRPAGF